MKVVFLGTSSSIPTHKRGLSSVALDQESTIILFDCGEGIQRQMRHAGIKPARTTRLCISHWHGDHVFGIPGLLSSMGADGATQSLEIYGPKGSRVFGKNMTTWFAAKEILPHSIHEVAKGIIVNEDEFTISSAQLKHSVACVGYKFKENDRLRIDVKKAIKLGLKGPILGKLQQGKSVTHKGKKIKSSDVTYTVPGKSICYITDTQDCRGIDTLAKNCDILILEGTLLDNLKDNAVKSKHITVREAAEIAKRNKVGKLVITHVSQRYKNNKEILAEAKKFFKNSLVAEDFMKIEV